MDQKKEILFLARYRDHVDHYEYLGVAPTDDRKEIRKAYFEFSRRFHPDTVFRKNAGVFGEQIESIFKRGTEIYELLTSNPEFRNYYFEGVNERNAIEAEKRADDLAARKKARIGRLKKQSAGRKESIKERLRKNSEARRTENRTRTVANRVDRAKSFYDEGMVQFEGERYVAATNSLRLAVNYDPNNQEYVSALALSER